VFLDFVQDGLQNDCPRRLEVDALWQLLAAAFVFSN
jgi:hypothetical protein